MPDAANLWELSDLCTPWCLHVVATLRIADHIAAGAVEIHDLERAAQCDCYVLHRVIEYCNTWCKRVSFRNPSPADFR
jgi:hypothetical protein